MRWAEFLRRCDDDDEVEEEEEEEEGNERKNCEKTKKEKGRMLQ